MMLPSMQEPGSSARSQAKVTVGFDMDMRLKSDGKRCAPMGVPYMPGGSFRSQSVPTMVLTSPGSWLEQKQERRAEEGRRHESRLRETTQRSALRGEPASPQRTQSFSNTYPGGGRTQGASRPQQAAGAYDPSKHGWYHPKGREETLRLADQKETGGHAWMMHKARDHGGFGEDGINDKRDNQRTAVSGDCPEWFSGPRTFPGPYGTRKHPVQRCPFVAIENGKMKVQAKTYLRGPTLSTIEVVHDRPTPPTPKLVKRAPIEHISMATHLHGGACDVMENLMTKTAKKPGY